jgi:membrane protein DedA with SNARE-associated domain
MLDAILNFSGVFAYLAVFAVLVASAVGLPFPEDLSLIGAGILVAFGRANLYVMALVCYLGIMVGDLIIYRLGWISGPALFRRRLFRRLLTAKRLKQIRNGLERRTFATILVARHLFYLRTATFLVCGAVRVSPTRFIIADAVAALITTPVMMGLGYFGAQHHEAVLQHLSQLKIVLVVLGVLAALALYLRYLHRR